MFTCRRHIAGGKEEREGEKREVEKKEGGKGNEGKLKKCVSDKSKKK